MRSRSSASRASSASSPRAFRCASCVPSRGGSHPRRRWENEELDIRRRCLEFTTKKSIGLCVRQSEGILLDRKGF